MKKIIILLSAIFISLTLMSMTSSDDVDFGDAKVTYSGPCGNYSMSANTVYAMYKLLPADVKKEFEKAYASVGGIYPTMEFTVDGVTLTCESTDIGDFYVYTIKYCDHTIKGVNIHINALNMLFKFTPIG